MGGELNLNSVSDLAESIRFQKLMLTAKILADRFRLSHFDLAPQGGPTFGEVGERTGHLKVVHIDNQDEPELGMEEAAGPIFDWFPAALSGSSVELLLPVPPESGLPCRAKIRRQTGFVNPRLLHSGGQRCFGKSTQVSVPSRRA
jgi:hypothetical protein